MFVERLRASTSSRLAMVGRDATVHDAAASLSRSGIGLVVVCDGAGSLEGVLSKSDLVRYLGRPNGAPPSVSTLMSTAVVACGPKDDVREVWQTMAARNLQNIPVLEGGARPVGILDIRDAMKALFEEEEIQERMLFNYVTGVGYR